MKLKDIQIGAEYACGSPASDSRAHCVVEAIRDVEVSRPGFATASQIRRKVQVRPMGPNARGAVVLLEPSWIREPWSEVERRRAIEEEGRIRVEKARKRLSLALSQWTGPEAAVGGRPVVVALSAEVADKLAEMLETRVQVDEMFTHRRRHLDQRDRDLQAMD